MKIIIPVWSDTIFFLSVFKRGEVGSYGRMCLFLHKNCFPQPTSDLDAYTDTRERALTRTLCCDSAHSCIACRIKAIRTSHCFLSISLSLWHTSTSSPRAHTHTFTCRRAKTLKRSLKRMQALYQIALSNMSSAKFGARVWIQARKKAQQ